MFYLKGAKLAWAGVLLGIELTVKPTFELFYLLFGGIIVDFITGVIKARVTKTPITSSGFRKTMVKFLQYLAPIVLFSIASKFVPEHRQKFLSACGYIMMFVIYIEITSIFENLYSMDEQSPISKNFYKPVLKILKFGQSHNPLTRAADKLEDKEDKK